VEEVTIGDGPCSGDYLLTKIIAHFLWMKHPGPNLRLGILVFASVSHFIRRGRCQTSHNALGIYARSVYMSHKLQKRRSIFFARGFGGCGKSHSRQPGVS
jgi:hypothetical protein